MAIKDNLAAFRTELLNTAQQYGRRIEDIKIMAVSKTRTVEEIIEAREAGLDLFGENRVEEATEKFSGLDAQSYPLVLIGHLQGNKVTRVDNRFRSVHSVDSLKIAHKLSAVRMNINRPLEVLMQVNTSGEDSKSGFRDRSEFRDAADEIASLPFIELKGLMTMAPFVDNESTVRRCFSLCRDWSGDLEPIIGEKPILSMGMSSDYRWAVAEGSTLLRIGTTLFGARG